MNIYNKEDKQNKMIEKIENFLSKTNGQSTAIDISNMNIFDALRTAITYSTKLFNRNPEQKICWSVKDEETKKMISSLKLRNMELKIKENTAENKVYAIK